MAIKNPFRTGKKAAQRAAADSVAARQGRATNLTMQADNWMADPSHDAQRDDFMSALRTQLGDSTDRNFADTARGTKFATARQGLTGGSTDIERQRRNLEDLFAERVNNEGKVQDAGMQLDDRTQQTYQALIDQAYGVADVGQSAMRNYASNAASGPGFWSTMYNTGQDLAGVWARRQQNDEFLRGLNPQRPAAQRNDLYAWNVPNFQGGQA